MMGWRVLDLPDDMGERADWLDRQLVSPGLHELVAELQAVRAAAGTEDKADRRAAARRFDLMPDAEAWLGDAREDVLSGGLAALPARRLGELLRSPVLLPAIQELVLVEGGPYWDRLAAARPDDSKAPATPVESPSAADSSAPVPSRRPAPAIEASPPRERPQVPLVKRPSFRLAVALAASVLVAAGIWLADRRSAWPAPWGWNAPAALTAASSATRYLERLAASAEEWFAETPATEAALDSRLDAMLAGCDRLIAAPHATLSAADRDWLVERCAAWRQKLVAHRDTLATSHDRSAVQSAADATIRTLAAALRSRAAAASG